MSVPIPTLASLGTYCKCTFTHCQVGKCVSNHTTHSALLLTLLQNGIQNKVYLTIQSGLLRHYSAAVCGNVSISYLGNNSNKQTWRHLSAEMLDSLLLSKRYSTVAEPRHIVITQYKISVLLNDTVQIDISFLTLSA